MEDYFDVVIIVVIVAREKCPEISDICHHFLSTFDADQAVKTSSNYSSIHVLPSLCNMTFMVSKLFSLSLSLFFALRYPHQDCIQCLGIKSSMRECRKPEYKICRFLAAVPFNRRQSGYAVTVVSQEEGDDPPSGRIERSARAQFGQAA